MHFSNQGGSSSCQLVLDSEILLVVFERHNFQGTEIGGRLDVSATAWARDKAVNLDDARGLAGGQIVGH